MTQCTSALTPVKSRCVGLLPRTDGRHVASRRQCDLPTHLVTGTTTRLAAPSVYRTAGTARLTSIGQHQRLSQSCAQVNHLNKIFWRYGFEFRLAGVTRTVNAAWSTVAVDDAATQQTLKSALRQGGWGALSLNEQASCSCIRVAAASRGTRVLARRHSRCLLMSRLPRAAAWWLCTMQAQRTC